MEEILVPIFICAVAPVSIVLIVFLSKIFISRQQTNVLIKAIEVNPGIDANQLAEALKKKRRTPVEILNLRLLRGCIFSLVGICLIINGCISASMSRLTEEGIFSGFLLLGTLSLAIGLSYLIVYFVTKKAIKDEANAEMSEVKD